MSKDLRIIFFGTPAFAVESLKCILQSGRKVVAVVTAPDRKAGRGRQIKHSAVKQYASKQNLPILQPTNLKSSEFIQKLNALKADIQIVVAFRMLPEAVWSMPPLGTFNLHASLLPKYRGAAPINWAIINGEKETGLTTFFLKHQIDTGDVLLQEKVPIEVDETAGSLHDKLMLQGGQLVLKSMQIIESGDFELQSQEKLIPTENPPNAPKLFKADCQIFWNQKALQVDRLIRGLSPYPAAWTTLYSGEQKMSLQLKIFACRISNKTARKPGKIEIDNKRLLIHCKDNLLELLEVQLEGKKRMKTADLLNGFQINNFKIKN